MQKHFFVCCDYSDVIQSEENIQEICRNSGKITWRSVKIMGI